MKKVIIILLSISVFFSCDYFSDDHEEFIDAYKHILIAREKYKDDSLKADKEVEKIYDKYGYTKNSFKEEFFEIAQEEPKRFRELLDSIRERAVRELQTIKEKQDTVK
jgi:dsDNA-specific endonuclease/ATPase MutS2